jgi:peptidoglycan/LPS O-acetylase OafA/YrhL
VLAHGNPVWREYSYLGGMDAIAMGCLTAIALHGRTPSRAWLRLLGVAGGALLVFCLAFSRTAEAWLPERTGLYMSVVGVGASMLIAVAALTGWRSPRVFLPLLMAGRRSYEIYLTHMFVVITMAAGFTATGDAIWAVPVFFVAVIVVSGFLGETVSRFYSEPLNRWLRSRWHDAATQMGSVVEENEAIAR